MRNLEQQTTRPAEPRLRDEPTARRLDTITPRATRWLWPGRVAQGQVTLVAGESSIENTKTGNGSAECGTRNAEQGMQSAERAGQTDASENEIGNPQESAKSSIENTKRRVARGARRRQPLPRRRRHAEAEGEAASAQFSDPTECKRHYDAPSAKPVEDPWKQDGVAGTPDDERLSIRDGESPPVLVATMDSNHLWELLTKKRNSSELTQEIKRVLRERGDPRVSMEGWEIRYER
jgi:hypothetical protein